MKPSLILTMLLAAAQPLFAEVAPALPAEAVAVTPLSPVERFNLIFGTQTFGLKYHLTNQPGLVETAEAIRGTGSTLIKFAVGPHFWEQYGGERDQTINTLSTQLAHDTSIQRVFDLPFATYCLWTYSFANGADFTQGFPAEREQREYKEIYAFVQKLLTRYSGSGKTFLLGHWEGDWHLRPDYDPAKDPSPMAIQGMITWLAIRQRAVDDAKRDTPHRDVFVWHYTEANLVQLGLAGKPCVARDVLPKVAVDYVSYSSYDSLDPAQLETKLPAALDFLKRQLTPKPSVPGSRVLIGEFGYTLAQCGNDPREQARLARRAARTAIAWGCDQVLWWAIYCNEIDAQTKRHRGYWMIDDQGRRQPIYDAFNDYQNACKNFVSECWRTTGQVPTPDAFRAFAIEVLDRPVK